MSWLHLYWTIKTHAISHNIMSSDVASCRVGWLIDLIQLKAKFHPSLFLALLRITFIPNSPRPDVIQRMNTVYFFLWHSLRSKVAFPRMPIADFLTPLGLFPEPVVDQGRRDQLGSLLCLPLPFLLWIFGKVDCYYHPDTPSVQASCSLIFLHSSALKI